MPDFAGKSLGRYEVTGLVGQGGMATVYRAHDPVLDRTVAIKVMHPHLAADPAFVGRFQHEAQAVAALSHPNIVKVFDFGVEEGAYYMVMEFVDGPTVATLLEERGSPLSTQQILRIFPPVCSAIDYAAARGMVHRDIKPANILLTPEGEPVVTDYGIAKLMGATSYTVAGTVMGSAHYMSPEQVQGLPTDERSDLYSLAVCLFEALTDRVPYDAETTASVFAQHLTAPVPLARSLNPDLPEEMQQVLNRALAKEPGQRFQHGSALATALRSALGSLRSPEPGPAVGSSPLLQPTVIVSAAAPPAPAGAAPPLAGATPPAPAGAAPPVQPGTPFPGATKVERAPMPPEVAASGPAGGMPAWQTGARRSRRNPKRLALTAAAVVVIGGAVAAAVVLTGLATDETTTTNAGGLSTLTIPAGATTTLSPQTAELISEGDSLVRAGLLDEGIAKYEAALQASPESDKAHTQLGLAYYLDHGLPPDLAPQQLQLATQENPTNGAAWGFLGLALLSVAYDFNSGDFNSAEQACRAALKLDVRDPRAHAFLAQVLQGEGRAEEAQAEIQTALDLAPTDPWVSLSAGWIASLRSQWADAVPYYQAAATAQPKWGRFLMLYAEALRESDAAAKAVGVYQTVLRLGQGYEADAYEGLGVALWKTGDLLGAITNLQASLAIDNQRDYANWALGAVLDEQGLYDQALPHLQAAATMVPNSAGYQEWLGDCLYKLGRYQEARTAVDKSLAVDPNREAAQQLSALLREKGY